MLSLLATVLLCAAPTPRPIVPSVGLPEAARSRGATALDAVRAALAIPAAQAEVADVRPTSARGCAPLAWEALRPVDGSGRAALRFTGRAGSGDACEGFAWASVRVTARGLVATRAVASGEPLSGAVALAELEVRPGHAPLSSLPDAAIAAHAVRAGAPLAASDLRVGPRPGQPVAVVVRAGGLELERAGRAVPCSRGLACALLPGGRRVEGRLEGGRIVVEAP